MTRRLLHWWVTWAMVGALIAALAYLALSRADGRTSYEAASPQQDRLGAATAPESGLWASDGSARLSEAYRGLDQSADGGGGAFRAGSADLTPLARPLSTASQGIGRPVSPSGRAAAVVPSLAVGSAQTCESPCSVDVAEWDVPTPEPRWTFNGLHPIAESWNVGVASGKASHVGAGFPSWYLALPIGPGFRVRIVGPGGEVTRVSTDAGPALHLQRPPDNRIADLSVSDFERVCGVPASLGLCLVSVAVLGRSH